MLSTRRLPCADLNKLELWVSNKCKPVVKMALLDGESISWSWQVDDYKRQQVTTLKVGDGFMKGRVEQGHECCKGTVNPRAYPAQLIP